MQRQEESGELASLAQQTGAPLSAVREVWMRSNGHAEARKILLEHDWNDDLVASLVKQTGATEQAVRNALKESGGHGGKARGILTVNALP